MSALEPTPAERPRLHARARAVALFGLAAWLCGNAYEEVVIVPNLAFGDARAAMVAFRAFFRSTNPVVYYVPLGPLVVASTALALFASRRDPPRRRLTARALVAVALAMALTAYIVPQLNFRLFLGPVLLDAALARSLARRWLALNLVRMVLASVALVFTLRARPDA